MNFECNDQEELILKLEILEDLMFLNAIITDANCTGLLLGSSLAWECIDQELRQDWMECVVPDLDEHFRKQLQFVYNQIRAVNGSPGDTACQVVIKPKDRLVWFSTLNQARLALEERYSFDASSQEELDARNACEDERMAFLRSQFYMLLQSLLLDLGLD